MRKATIAALAALCAGVTLSLTLPQPARAVPGQTAAQTGARHGGGRLAKLSDALGLTDAQKAQIKPILKSAAQQARAVKQDTTLAPDARKAKLKDIRKDTMSQILPLLTPDQKQKLAAMRRERREQG